jgi:hypothetical protein
MEEKRAKFVAFLFSTLTSREKQVQSTENKNIRLNVVDRHFLGVIFTQRKIITKIKPFGNMQKSAFFEGVENEMSQNIELQLIPRQAYLLYRMTL